MKLMITSILMLAIFATGAMAQQTVTFGWEDGVSTHLGTYGNVGETINVSDMANTGTHSLYMTEDPVDGTPQVFVAWIANLVEGDEVTVSFFSFDETDNTYPRSRIWGHYTPNADITAYDGSAGGNSDYTTGIGWEEQTHTWTMPADKEALCVEFRMYSAEGAVTYWVDDVTVTAPETATVFVPNMEPVSSTVNTFGGVKALFR